MLAVGTKFLESSFLQPKWDIGQMVEGNGGLAVATRLPSFEEAVRQPSIARSEGPWEHALNLRGRRVGGVSGLLESFTVNDDTIARARRYSPDGMDSPRELFLGALRRRMEGGTEAVFHREMALTCQRQFRPFCCFSGISEEDFLAQTSFTYWKKLGGMNATLVADDIFPGRYHVMVSEIGPKMVYGLIDASNRNVLRESAYRFPNWRDILKQYPLAEFYEMVRGMTFFDPNHCPIIECQLLDGGIVFLQYHIGRDFTGRQFKLERDARNEEREVFLYRGATALEGMDVDIAVDLPNRPTTFDPVETGSFDRFFKAPTIEQTIYLELAWRFMFASLRQQRGSVLGPSWHYSNLYDLATGHTRKSAFFKPGMALLGDFLGLIPEDDQKKAREAASHENRVLPARFHVTADGERSFVRYLGLVS